MGIYSKGTEKDALLLLPGGGQTAQSNFQLIQEFENDYTVICPTLYDVDSIDEFCHAINIILKKTHVNTVVLYGLSLGGMMAQSYAKRYQKIVKTLIISHSPAPESALYKKKIILPLKILHFILPIIPMPLISFVSKKYTVRFQGGSNKETPKLLEYFVEEFYKRYFTKRLLYTWIFLHVEFSKERFTLSDFSFLKNNILILKTDNDPLAQDDGEFLKIYPSAKVVTFHGSGHLTFQYQFDKIVGVIKKFMSKH